MTRRTDHIARLGSGQPEGDAQGSGRESSVGPSTRRENRVLLECELLDRSRFATREAARLAIFEWLETWYSPRRRHSALAYLAPLEYERRWQMTYDDLGAN
ncbi:MAG: hypothetical protein M3P38_01225 [Chloroflexota bacterium]|nr:hypothetical protein [Chloroflexota bacterium]